MSYNNKNKRGISPISAGMKLKQRNRQISSSERNISYNRNHNNVSIEDDIESDIPFEQKRYMFEENNRRIQQHDNSNKVKSPLLHGKVYNETRLNSHKANDYKKPPPGPPKPARTIDRRREMSG